jgi:cryptochrome
VGICIGRPRAPLSDAHRECGAQGWLHHLARHAVACFLTRGDLWQPWDDGARVFEYLLVDADWAINAANWQWLSCARFFHDYRRCYSPIAFGRKHDPQGVYIRHWLPQLARMPVKYVHTPWLAPKEVQAAAGCVVGRDYPAPIVDHAVALKDNLQRLQAVFAAARGDRASYPHEEDASAADEDAGMEPPARGNSSAPARGNSSAPARGNSSAKRTASKEGPMDHYVQSKRARPAPSS